MGEKRFQYVYGPVPSRRLGRSLGVDLVPYKTCTYDCLYCQLGPTTRRTVRRRDHAPQAAVLAEAAAALGREKPPQVIGLAGSGEPTLHSGIGPLIRALKKVSKIPVAVLTNGSLLWRKSVRDALMAADLVIPSLDAGDAETFERVNRPHESIDFQRMVAGIADFTAAFAGEVWLEVLLLAGLTDTPAAVKRIATAAEGIGPARVQLGTVIRPPAETAAAPLSGEALAALAPLFTGKVEIIAPAAPDAGPAVSGVDREAVFAMLRRRPCTLSDVAEGLGIHKNEAVKHLDRLLSDGRIAADVIGGEHFYRAKDS